jgi:hypothetical protein
MGRIKNRTEASMIRFKLFVSTAILSAAIANSALAQTIVPEPTVYASNEITTKPWPAPVGHRQPRAIDIPASASHQSLDPEDANVDRKISGVCRGC